MKQKLAVVLVLAVLLLTGTSFACTIIAVGKDAMADGSTIITHNDDSSGADFRLWIIPEMDWPEGSVRDIVIDSHNYIDYSDYPNVDVGLRGTKIAEIPQVPHTYRYFHSRYSFMNEKGVAIGESTFGISTATDYGKEVRKALYTDSMGIIDCWTAQDIALERASTAREAVRVMGDMVEKYGWSTAGGGGEIMDITDGNEVWVAEFYGLDLWVAVRVPDDCFFVGANVARIRDVDLNDTENVMHSPNLVTYAVEKGWYDPNSGEPFRPADVYAPRSGTNIREWRALDMVAPSMSFQYGDLHYPLWVKPDRKLTVHDIFVISGDYYEGTEFDLTKGAGAGPFGDPLASYRVAGRQRPIGIPLTCYVHIGQVKEWLPDPIKGVSWYGYGAVSTSYITPLWPIMAELPDFYQNGSRYETFRRDSGWWTNTYVQEMTRLRWMDAIQDVRNFRDPKLESLYKTVPQIQKLAAELYATDPEAAKAVVSDFAYNTAASWHENWLALGDMLLGKYCADRIFMRGPNYPKEWVEALETLNTK